MNVLAYKTAKSIPVKFIAINTKKALETGDKMGALWLSIAGKLIGKTIDGKWMLNK